jgi:hypothetical protein
VLQPVLALHPERRPWMITTVAPEVLILFPEEYAAHELPLLVLYRKLSLQPTPPLPELKVALTISPEQTLDWFGFFEANVGAEG